MKFCECKMRVRRTGAGRPRCAPRWWLATLLVCAAGLSGRAAVYDFALGDAGNRTLRMNVPDGLLVVRGLLIWGNGAGSDQRAMATDPEAVALAQSLGFAVIGTSMWSNFAYGYNPSELSGFEYGLQQLAAMSGHPEIVVAPWLPIGQSNGGCMSYGLNVLHPEKVIAMAANKGAGYNDPRPALAALRTPGLLLAGEIDTDVRRANIRDLFVGNRPRGALWAWAEEQMANHNTGDTYELILPFVEEMCRARYPANASPANGPVSLLAVDETSGWLADPDSGKTGLVAIAPYASYPKDKTAADWLPSRRMAYLFRAFASYSLARYEVRLSTGHGPVDWGTRTTFSIGQPVAAWSAIEFYDGDTLLKTIHPADGVPLAVDTILSHPGYAVFHALITFADGSQQTTMIRRVLVRAPADGAVAGATTVATGGGTVLAVAAPAGVSYQWQIDLGGGWQSLSDGAAPAFGGAVCAGARTAALALSAVPVALDGAQLRCAYGGASVSRVCTLSVSDAPSVSVVQGAPGEPVVAGQSVTLAVQSSDANASCQWWRDGVAIAGVAGKTWTFAAGAADAGEYRATVTAANGLTTTVDAGSLAVVADSQLINLSARAYVQTGDNVLIAGFVTAGPDASARKTILLRGVGPTLSLPRFGIADALPHARLNLFNRAGTSVDSNTKWEADLAPTFARLGAFALVDGSDDAALLESFGPGPNTVHLSSPTGTPGIGLVEIYDADDGSSTSRLVNISARANVGLGDNVLIGGFVVRGASSVSVLIRGVGLGMRQFLPATLLQPVLTVFDAHGRAIATNTGWLQPIAPGNSTVAARAQPASARAMARVGAFLLPEPEMTGYQAGWDSAMLLTLPPGLYSAVIGSADGSTGIAMIEIYEVR